MGYKLTSLLRLPVQEEVSLYVFVVGASIWEGGLDEVVRRNFDNLAREFGPDAVIVDALTAEFHGEVVRQYLGTDFKELKNLMPAILLTDSHPDDLTSDSMRVLVPLGDIHQQYVVLDTFLAELASFARGESDQLLRSLEQASRLKSAAAEVVRINIPVLPGVVTINLNHAFRHLKSWYKSKRTDIA